MTDNPPDGTHELVIDASTGRVRQAGSDGEGPWLVDFRTRCERDLFRFAKAILGRKYLTTTLHAPLCDWISRCPPTRKLLLVPRNHAKTSIVSHALPIHLMIQPTDTNIYLPGRDGGDTRLLLAGETESMAMKNLRVVMSAFESNRLLRGLWPHRCWDNPRKQSKKWNEKEIIVPRPTEFGDPSIRAIGVDGAVTGSRVDACIKDDLIAIEAANSPAAMESAMRWHRVSRSLFESDGTLEWIIGTPWAPHDVYAHIMSHDPSVEVMTRSIVESGAPIWPERFSLTGQKGKINIAQLQTEFGALFWLQYMCTYSNPELTDFNMAEVRSCTVMGDRISYEEDERDVVLAAPLPPRPTPQHPSASVSGTPHWMDKVEAGRDAYLRVKAR